MELFETDKRDVELEYDLLVPYGGMDSQRMGISIKEAQIWQRDAYLSSYPFCLFGVKRTSTRRTPSSNIPANPSLKCLINTLPTRLLLRRPQ